MCRAKYSLDWSLYQKRNSGKRFCKIITAFPSRTLYLALHSVAVLQYCVLAQLVKGQCLLFLIAKLCSNQVALLSPLQQLAGKVQLL